MGSTAVADHPAGRSATRSSISWGERADGFLLAFPLFVDEEHAVPIAAPSSAIVARSAVLMGADLGDTGASWPMAGRKCEEVTRRRDGGDRATGGLLRAILDVIDTPL